MKVALLEEYGGIPEVAEADVPLPGDGESLIKVSFASLNPVDLRIAAGNFYSGSPNLPYVPGSEGVGTVVNSSNRPEGSRVRFGSARPGAFAEYVVASEPSLLEIPDGLPEEDAATLGVPGIAAYLSLVDAAGFVQGERVAVLGATGVAGSVATQLAAILGAGSVVALGRNADVLKHVTQLARKSSDVCSYVLLDNKPAELLAKEIVEAAGGPVDVVIDPLWGTPALAALLALNKGGRLVNLGESAGSELSVPSALLRSKQAKILGYSNFGVPLDRHNEALSVLMNYVLEGKLEVSHSIFGISSIGEAWTIQRGSPGRKLLISPVV